MKPHLLFFFFFFNSLIFGQEKIQVDTLLMGSPFRFVVYDENETKGKNAIYKAIDEVVRIENLLSEWKNHSPISVINQAAGKEAIIVNNELFTLFEKAKTFSEISNGLFDITYAGMERIWKYDGSMTKIPTEEQIKKALEGVGNHFLQLDAKRKTVFLAHPRTRISFGSIGKAYAAEKAMAVLKKLEIKNAMVNASGDIVVIGTPPNKKHWNIGIYQPYKKKKYLPIQLKKKSIVTSGDYEKFALIDDTKYGHIINPKTGFPSTEISSVSVQGDDAVIANFLSTTMMLTNTKQRKQLQRLFPEYSVYIQKRK